MTLVAGSRLGPYEILAPIGAGGMGEVYRAKDPRLAREVAIKVLPASFSGDADRLRRFEQEAKAAGLLNHPNITIVYDIGQADGAPYVVQELLEGETLRAVLAGGRVSARKAIDYALQIVHGLAAAHEKGIVHRDLKPENVFVTTDGRVKILDFGLAKLTHSEVGVQVSHLPTATAGTEPGVVLGTLGYMSPEQVRGKAADARSDIFSFGTILYEMLSGRRPFTGDSAADTMSAILKEDPPDLSVTSQNVSPGLERVVGHCLEKNPERRFQSARDLAFSLEALSGASGPRAVETPRAPRRRRLPWPLLSAAAAAALLGLAFWVGRRTAASALPREQPGYRRITFRRGNVLFARFTSDGQSIAYSAAWGNQPAEIFLARVGSRESRPLGIPNANILSVSSTDELAVLLKKTDLYGAAGRGTLARVPIGGGAPRQILEDVYEADWSPDGKELAVLRRVDGKRVIEYPLGTRLARADTLGSLRVSPDGSSIAVVDNSDSGSVATIDRAGKRRVLARGYIYVDSLSWQPSGKEIWFDAVALGPDGAPFVGIFAVDLSGRARTVSRAVDLEVVHDIGRDGRVLVEREVGTREILFSSGDAGGEHDLSWLDQSAVACLSRDGKALLFDEFGEAGGPKGSVYLRTTDGAPAVRLGDGRAQDLSQDGRWALALAMDGKSFVLLPTGVGEPRRIPVPGLQVIAGSFVPPDERQIAFPAIEPGHSVRGYLMDVAGGKPRAFTGEGLTGEAALSPNGTEIVLNGADNRPMVFSFAGGDPRPLRGLEPGDIAIQWSSDGRTLFLTRSGELPQRVYRYDFASGRKTLWKDLLPADRTGLIGIERLVVAADGNHYAYTSSRVTNSDLYVVTGWK